MTAMKASLGILLTIMLLASGDAASAQQRPGRRAGDLRMPDTLRVGDVAPDFKLKTMNGSREVTLSSFKGKRPVVLIFGSYT
jgi:cytochrome oxidase Cu insertion factor (SCO1/SenC/PrrC family)